VDRLQDGVDAEAEQEGAQRVALLLPGAGQEYKKTLVPLRLRQSAIAAGGGGVCPMYSSS
jgi:hypothetical protein